MTTETNQPGNSPATQQAQADAKKRKGKKPTMPMSAAT